MSDVESFPVCAIFISPKVETTEVFRQRIGWLPTSGGKAEMWNEPWVWLGIGDDQYGSNASKVDTGVEPAAATTATKQKQQRKKKEKKKKEKKRKEKHPNFPRQLPVV